VAPPEIPRSCFGLATLQMAAIERLLTKDFDIKIKAILVAVYNGLACNLVKAFI